MACNDQFDGTLILHLQVRRGVPSKTDRAGHHMLYPGMLEVCFCVSLRAGTTACGIYGPGAIKMDADQPEVEQKHYKR